MSENVRLIVKCVAAFKDGNCTPSEVKKDEILDLSEDEFHKLKKSGPMCFELIDKKFRIPEEVREEIFDTPDYGEEDISQEQYGVENVVEWKPVPWYAAQLARKPADEVGA